MNGLENRMAGESATCCGVNLAGGLGGWRVFAMVQGEYWQVQGRMNGLENRMAGESATCCGVNLAGGLGGGGFSQWFRESTGGGLGGGGFSQWFRESTGGGLGGGGFSQWFRESTGGGLGGGGFSQWFRESTGGGLGGGGFSQWFRESTGGALVRMAVMAWNVGQRDCVGTRSWGWGMRTDCMPARVAASMPMSVSSKTRQVSGGTLSFCAARRKGSGSGLDFS
jgi:hypothetical protein